MEIHSITKKKKLMGAKRAELFSTAQLLLVKLRAPSTGLGAGYFREDKGTVEDSREE